MSDIYHQLVMHCPEFRQHSDEDLAECSGILDEAARAISGTLTLIGNLTLEATLAEDYSNENARRDLMLIGDALRHLPRMAQALEQSSNTARFVLKQRREVFNDQHH